MHMGSSLEESYIITLQINAHYLHDLYSHTFTVVFKLKVPIFLSYNTTIKHLYVTWNYSVNTTAIMYRILGNF